MSDSRSRRGSNLMLAVRKFGLSAFVVLTFAAYAVHERAALGDDSSNPLPDEGDALSPQMFDLNQPPPALGLLGDDDGQPLTQGISLVSVSSAAVPTRNLPTAIPTTLVAPAKQVTAAPTATSLPPTQTPTETPTATPTQTATAIPTTAVPPTDLPPMMTNTPSGQYIDGEYIGPVTDALYGPMQVKVIIRDGQINSFQVLDYPHDRRTSQQINHIALPRLAHEIIRAQNAHVDIISGATLSSQAFLESLQVALDSARTSA